MRRDDSDDMKALGPRLLRSSRSPPARPRATFCTASAPAPSFTPARPYGSREATFVPWVVSSRPLWFPVFRERLVRLSFDGHGTYLDRISGVLAYL